MTSEKIIFTNKTMVVAIELFALKFFVFVQWSILTQANAFYL